MNVLVMQPKLESSPEQLESALARHLFVDMAVFPEGYLNENVEQACELARRSNTVLIGGYRKLHERPKDWAILMDRNGEVLVDRPKYSPVTIAEVEGLRVGHLLCDELVLQGVQGAKPGDLDVLIHPIGVGMFSEEQFAEWTEAARQLAADYRTIVIGASHADGSYGDTGVSIPIAYCYDPEGSPVFVAKNDVRPRVVHIHLDERRKPVVTSRCIG